MHLLAPNQLGDSKDLAPLECCWTHPETLVERRNALNMSVWFGVPICHCRISTLGKQEGSTISNGYCNTLGNGCWVWQWGMMRCGWV